MALQSLLQTGFKDVLLKAGFLPCPITEDAAKAAVDAVVATLFQEVGRLVQHPGGRCGLVKVEVEDSEDEAADGGGGGGGGGGGAEEARLPVGATLPALGVGRSEKEQKKGGDEKVSRSEGEMEENEDRHKKGIAPTEHDIETPSQPDLLTDPAPACNKVPYANVASGAANVCAGLPGTQHLDAERCRETEVEDEAAKATTKDGSERRGDDMEDSEEGSTSQEDLEPEELLEEVWCSDLLGFLGLDPNFDPLLLRKAFLRKCILYHPDKAPVEKKKVAQENFNFLKIASAHPSEWSVVSLRLEQAHI